jgi:peroxiredoxin
VAQLGGLQEHIAEIRAKGGDVLALSADDQLHPRDGLPDAASLGLTFPTLSDPQRRVIHAYGLLNPNDVLVPAEGGLAYPSTYILDKNGVVRWRYIGTDLADRPDIDLVLGAFAKVAGA